MDTVARCWRRICFLFQRSRFRCDLENEMRFHVEMQAEENRQSGMDAEEARNAAMRQFGNRTIAREESREAWGWGAVESFARDTAFAFRMMRRTPAFTAVVAILALGIGANTAVYSVANALLLNPFPFREPQRIVAVEARHISGRNSGTGYLEFLDWREQNTVFEEMAISPSFITSRVLTGEGEPQRIVGGRTTHGFLRVLGVQPAVGRFYAAEEDRPAATPVAVLSYAAWQRYFGGRPDIVGHVMAADGVQLTIIGIMPKNFVFPGRTCDFWEPLRDSPGNGRSIHQYSVIARLKPGITVERAQADMSTIARRLEREYPESNTGCHVIVTPIGQALAQVTQKPVAVLFAAVVSLVLLACANVAALLLGRASGRAKEIAIRAALGAGRLSIVRQMLTESAVLAVAGGILGLVVAHSLVSAFKSAAPPQFGLDSTLRMDSAVLAFTLVSSLLTAFLFGLAPALQASKTDLNAVLKGGACVSRCGRPRSRLLSTLVVEEVALSLVLLIGAALLAADFVFLLKVNTGIRTEHVLTFSTGLPRTRYLSSQSVATFYRELMETLSAAPGVVAAGAVGSLPMGGHYQGGEFEIEGRAKPRDWMEMSGQYNVSTPGYFRSMGIPILKGRDFSGQDTASALPVIVINETLVRQFFPGEDPLGRRIKHNGWRTIVGIA